MKHRLSAAVLAALLGGAVVPELFAQETPPAVPATPAAPANPASPGATVTAPATAATPAPEPIPIDDIRLLVEIFHKV